jgi:hypothetical protein
MGGESTYLSSLIPDPAFYDPHGLRSVISGATKVPRTGTTPSGLK